jgi:hypothetical protein
MATSGTTAFTLDIGDILEEAYELCGMEMRTGYDYKSAKRALNLVFLEWQNKGLNLWTLAQGTISVTAGTNTYSLESSAIDVIDAFIRTDAGDITKQIDQRMTRISRTEYNHQSNKLTRSKPTQYFIDKNTGTNSIVLWATPDDAKTYTVIYDYVKRIEDAGITGASNADVPARYLPCLTYALAFNIACKSPTAQQRVPMIKMRYEELWKDVSEADRERSNVKFVPDLSYMN